MHVLASTRQTTLEKALCRARGIQAQLAGVVYETSSLVPARARLRARGWGLGIGTRVGWVLAYMANMHSLVTLVFFV